MMCLLNKISKIGLEWQNVLTEMLRFLHHIAMVKFCPKTWNQIFIKNNENEIKKIAENNSKYNIQLCYKILLNGRKELFFSPNHKIGVEMTLLRAITEIEK
jgi:DNA polymerase-3 subunit gamma/tau